jgi:CRISPR-associated endonuclease/helicase Cas3
MTEAEDSKREWRLAEEWLARALNLGQEQSPFPWQIELLRCFLRGDEVSSLDIPTGLGKTATMAIWLVARALGAHVPCRLIYVVDRRAVVDQATEVAESLREWVQGEATVAAALCLENTKLPISTLRGQHVDNRAWLDDPSVPAIVVGTVDMVGSRLLFEGYRCSRKMRPYHAAMLGADALIVLDEAHLVPPFEAMIRAAAGDDRFKPQADLGNVIPASRVLALSATGRSTECTLRLGEADRTHTVVKRRLEAKKHARFTQPVEASALASSLAQQAWQLRECDKRAQRVIIFADSRRTAQAVLDALQILAKGSDSKPKIAIETELLVGGRRIAEREKAAERLRTLGVIAGSKRAVETPVFIVATSAGEVGVDLDADHAVMDLVEWERIVQRLGRVNRRGEGDASIWIVPSVLDEKTEVALAKEEKLGTQGPSDIESDVVEGEDPEEAGADGKATKKLNSEERSRVDRWKRLEATQRAIRRLPQSDKSYDASPRALADLKREEPALIEAASTPAPLHPELTRAVLEAWSMTSLEQHTGRPRVHPWLRGWVEEEPQTAIVWRSSLPRADDAVPYFEAAPIETAEILETETKIVFDWLGKRAKQAVRVDADGGGVEVTPADREPIGPKDAMLFLLSDRMKSWTLEALNTLDKRGRDELFRDIAGETLVVDARVGGLSASGLLDASESGNARDAADVVALPFRVRVAETTKPEIDGWRVESAFVLRETPDGDVSKWLIVETDPAQQSSTEDARSTGRAQLLSEHQAFAERHARRIGKRVGLKPAHVELLALAASLHDEGKAAPRWQRAFRVPDGEGPLGKTTSRPIQSILAGYRHELGSLTYAERDSRVAALSMGDRDLVLHLIAAHHGYARPLIRTDGCDDAPPSMLVGRQRTIALRFARLEKRWGIWGLAWWETLLRAADQTASRENDERGGEHG